MHWILAAPFITGPHDVWLDRFVTGSRHRFETIPATYGHDRSRPRTSARQWSDYFSHGDTVWRARQRAGKNAGIVTVFPQLALAVGARQRLSLQRTPVLAWTFNLGRLRGGAQRRIAQLAMRRIDRFVVHSRREVASYSDWLDCPAEKFSFVPLQRPARPIEFAEDVAHPFVLSMGSAQRDYRLFLDVMAGLGYPTLVIAGPQALAGLKIPSNVSVLDNLGIAECHALAQRARVNVVPTDNPATASGQISLLDAMMFARPTVATRSIGTEDYVEDGRTALLVPAGDHAAMREAISGLWEDTTRRARIGAAARRFVLDQLTDEAAGAALGRLLDELADANRN